MTQTLHSQIKKVSGRTSVAYRQRVLARVVEVLDSDQQERLASRLGRPSSHVVEARALHVIARELELIDSELISSGQQRLTSDAERKLTDWAVASALGVGPIEMILADPSVEEITATRWDLVFVYRSDGSIEVLDEPLWRSEQELVDWLAHQARTAGRTERAFNAQRPLLVMRIGEGLRLAAHRDVAQHVGFALRRNALGRVTLDDLTRRQTIAEPLANMLRAVMRSTEMRIVFAGPTGAGKSTMARACLAELSPEKHVVIIEDTAELDFFEQFLHPNVESWEQRESNAEGEGAVSMGELVKHGLRVRPDWLVAGEVRDSDSSVPMIKAMTHGQSSLTTVHAIDAVGALDKLAVYLGTGEDKLPMSVAHHQLSVAIDFVVHLDRSADGTRYVTEVIEVEGFDGERCTTNSIYRQLPGRRPVGSSKLSARRRDKLARAGFDTADLATIDGQS